MSLVTPCKNPILSNACSTPIYPYNEGIWEYAILWSPGDGIEWATSQGMTWGGNEELGYALAWAYDSFAEWEGLKVVLWDSLIDYRVLWSDTIGLHWDAESEFVWQ